MCTFVHEMCTVASVYSLLLAIIYIAFVVIAVVIGKLAGRVARLEVPATRCTDPDRC